MFQTCFEKAKHKSSLKAHSDVTKLKSNQVLRNGSIQKPQRALAPHIRAWNGEAHLGDQEDIRKVLSGTKNGNKVILPHFRPPHARLLR